MYLVEGNLLAVCQAPHNQRQSTDPSGPIQSFIFNQTAFLSFSSASSPPLCQLCCLEQQAFHFCNLQQLVLVLLSLLLVMDANNMRITFDYVFCCS
jgi:hypothetical protein